MSRPFPYWFAGAIAAWVTYTVVWTQLALERLNLLRASVFDLGVYAQAGQRVFSTPMSPGNWLATSLNFGSLIFLSPTTIGGYPVILAAQSCALGSGAVLLYLIARQYDLPPPWAFGLSAAYLLYFPLSGISFTDAHFEVYLIPLFLLGVWLFLRGNFVLSFAMLVLAGDVQFPLCVFPMLFGLQLAIPEICGALGGSLTSGPPSDARVPIFRKLLRTISGWRFTRSRAPAPEWYVYGLTFVSLVLLLGAWITSDFYLSNYTIAFLVHANSLGVMPNLSVKLWTLFLLLAPLGFMPLLSPRWLPYCIPFFILEFYVNYWGYTYPYVATSWYGFLVVPFLLLATIDAVAQIREGTTWVHRLWHRLRPGYHPTRVPDGSAHEGSDSAPSPRSVDRRWHVPGSGPANGFSVATGAVVTFTVVSAGFLTPFGPWNSSTSANFQIPVFQPYNSTLYNELTKLASYVPSSDPSVILQDNMPELLPRSLFPGLTGPLVPGPFSTLAYNLTWLALNGSWVPIEPDYVIADPVPSLNSFFDSEGAYPFNISMAQIVTELYATYDYGIVGEANGMLLLKHYYTGPILYYVPFSAEYPASTFQSNVSARDSPSCGASCWVATDLRDQQIAWYGPYPYLSPGVYNVSVHLGLANWTPGDRVRIEVTGDHGLELLNSTLLAGLTVGPQTTSTYCNMTIFVGGATPGVEFRAVDSDFNGSLALYGVHVQQVAPPSTVFRVGDTPHDAAVYRLLGLVPPGWVVLSEPALRPYFHNLTQRSVPAVGPVPAATYALYDPAIPSPCVPNGNNTLCQLVNKSLASGSFSIAGQVDGVTLLGPNGSALDAYSPFNQTIPLSELITRGSPGQNFTRESNGTLTITDQNNSGYAWAGPYASLPPGKYAAELELSVTNTSALNHLLIAVTSNWGKEALGTLWVDGANFTGPNESTTVTLPFNLTGFSNSIEIVGKEVNWAGVVTLRGIQVVETAPPA